MATKNITGINDETILVTTSNNTYNVVAGAKVVATGGQVPGDLLGAIMEDPNGMPLVKNNIYNIDGRLYGQEVGIFTHGANNEIHVGETGKISGESAVGMTGNKSVFTNDGALVATLAYGVYGSAGIGQQFRNDGSITGVAGIIAQGTDKVLIVNGEDGEIMAIQGGIGILSAAGATGKFINHGLVAASLAEGFAVVGGEGNETVINDGTFIGSVILAGGDDILDNRGGSIQGSIAGGMGDDVLIVDRAKDKLLEAMGEGDDTIRSSVSYKLSENVEKLVLTGKANIDGTGTAGADLLHGNAGNNTLKGLAGTDELWGHKGNDKLFGGAGADIFHFVKGDGKDAVMDFEQTVDKIDISDWTGIDDLADVVSHATDVGADVLIKLGTDSLLIKGVHEAELTNGDFSF